MHKLSHELLSCSTAALSLARLDAQGRGRVAQSSLPVSPAMAAILLSLARFASAGSLCARTLLGFTIAFFELKAPWGGWLDTV